MMDVNKQKVRESLHLYSHIRCIYDGEVKIG